MKFCNKCGNRYPDNMTVCSNCENSLSDMQPQQYQANPVYGNQHQVPMRKDYTQIGGLLMFFAVLNLIVSFVSLVIYIINIDYLIKVLNYSMSDNKNVLVCSLIAQIISIFAAFGSITFAVQVFIKNPLFLRVEQITRIISIFTFIIGTLLPVFMFNAEASVYHFISSIVGTVSGLFLMTLYYCRSMRVRVYMGSDEYMEKAIFCI